MLVVSRIRQASQRDLCQDADAPLVSLLLAAASPKAICVRTLMRRWFAAVGCRESKGQAVSVSSVTANDREVHP